ncbi:hypothetical protein VKT23_008085 [Stygiomarasmius scandens]|uniref:Uncharacterized protein n=1 Tax=Marasmiellus scandens TaxID=2682957 RepID=A0ABR1JH71_9AGAR
MVVIASAIPQVQTISGHFAAICIVHRLIKADGTPIGEDPGQIQPEEFSERRAFFGGNWFFNLVLFLRSLTMAALVGMYSSGLSSKETFNSNGAATSFGRGTPV